jgi:threonine/homoserine/homoserine lactone efflux protein
MFLSQHLWIGFSSSFVGALPLGVLNMTVLKFSLADQPRKALEFSIGAVLIEFFQVFITLLGLNILLSIPYLKEVLGVISIPILVYLAISNLKATAHTNESEGGRHRAFIRGVLLSLANVLIYPFWILWGSVFIQNGWLSSNTGAYFVFSLGASAGAMGAYLVFIVLGKLLWRYVAALQQYINQVLAYTFLGFAMWQGYRLVIFFF